MIANNTTEFLTKASGAICNALNNEAGQRITEKLLEKAREQNPNLTAEEWQQMKQQFVLFVFAEYMKRDKEAMDELAGHFYNELRNDTEEGAQ